MDEARSSGSTPKLSRISPSLPASRLYKSHFRGHFCIPLAWARASPASHAPPAHPRSPLTCPRSPLTCPRSLSHCPSAEHEPVDVGGELEVKVVLVRRIVIRREDAVEDMRLGGRAHHRVELPGLRRVRSWGAGPGDALLGAQLAVKMLEHVQYFPIVFA